MEKQIFDIIVILIIAAFLLVLWYFDVLEQSAKFMFVPILAFYYLGRFVERKL